MHGLPDHSLLHQVDIGRMMSSGKSMTLVVVDVEFSRTRCSRLDGWSMDISVRSMIALVRGKCCLNSSGIRVLTLMLDDLITSQA